MFSDTERHLMNLYPTELGLLSFFTLGLEGVLSELSTSSFLTKPSYLFDLLLLLDDRPVFLLMDLSSSNYLCYSFLKYQTRKLDTMTLIVKNRMTITIKNDPPSNAVTSVLSWTLSSNFKSSNVIWVFGSNPLMPANNSGITSLIAGTRKDLKP